jgi:hypothetical protein
MFTYIHIIGIMKHNRIKVGEDIWKQSSLEKEGR